MSPPKSFRKSSRAAPFLRLSNAAFRLGDRLVFENLTWSMLRNEQWAIIGANSSGKSVLADALRGMVPLVQGDLRYFFKAPSGLSPEDAIGHVAFEDRKSELHGTVVQSRWTSFEQEESVSVAEFLSYDRVMEINPFEVTNRHDAARPVFQRRLERTTGLLQLEPLLERALISLSNGERQRVQLARALARPLRLLILDEPYVGLDAGMRAHFHRLLERLLKTPLRLLLVTARVEDLPRHVTHLLLVDDCRVVLSGPRETVLRQLGASRYSRRQSSKRSFATRSRRRTVATPGKLVKLIELRNVTVRYGTRTVLRRVDWTVNKGESWALLGPNGSGKTTLLSLIMGDHPQAYVNEVIVFGRRRGNGESIWDLKKPIGWVSPELHLHFNDSVSVSDVVLSGFYETVGLFEKATARQSASARYWLAKFGLLKSADQPLFSLSAGLQRMTLLARALVKCPTLLILDEPCQGLDSFHREVFLRKIDALIRSRTLTAIYVTHRVDEIPASIERVLRLSSSGSVSAEPLKK